MNYTIDATNKSLGRLATEVATILMSKNDPSFARNTLSGNSVTVTNASKIKMRPEKSLEKTYLSFSGYPGGLKERTMAHVIDTNVSGTYTIAITAVGRAGTSVAAVDNSVRTNPASSCLR